MPVYEYRCSDCGHEFDQRQGFNDPRLTDCPSCSAEGSLKKVFGNVGVSFKGSGFYRNDSRSSNSGKLSSNASKPADKKAESATGSSKSEGSAKSSESAGSASKGSTSKGSAKAA
ncbi:FmdB family zinc ribbon protein [Salininema proteolyticum]|uniref:FmdB family zinc ribbon protein n=1 Tax=Salininema proteolyticum TaxID=1607685 RepID=A0ABV8TWC8_9ACTN